MRDKPASMVRFAAIVSLVCSILVAGSAVLLRDRQETNRLLDRRLKVLAVAGLVEGDRHRGEDDVGLGGEQLVGDGLDDRPLDGRPVAEPGLDLDLTALGGGAGEDDAALGRDPELHAVPGGDDHDGVDELAAPRAGGQEEGRGERGEAEGADSSAHVM